ncbi:MAG: SPFH domain-containing protein [Reyranellaceae bacterium]
MSLAERALGPEEALRRRRRHRLATRLGLLAIFLSALVLSGLLYFETTALAPGRAALVIRGGELVRVAGDAGHVYRIPVLDRIVLVDLTPQPLPTLRQALAGSDGARAIVELQAGWQVVDAGAYWRAVAAKPALAGRLIETAIDRALRSAVAGQPLGAPVAIETRQALARTVAAGVADGLARAGLRLVDLRVTSVQTIRQRNDG